MTVISKKLFYDTAVGTQMKCDFFHLGHTSCRRSALDVAQQMLFGSFKFFLPIYILKSALFYKKLRDKKFRKDIVVGHLRSVLYGILFGTLAFSTICVTFKLTGQLQYYSLGFWSGIVSGLSLLVETPENKLVDTIIFFNLAIEALLRNLDFFSNFKLTNARQTVMFMTVNAVLMYLLENRKESLPSIRIWFFIPPKRNLVPLLEEEKAFCNHDKSCTRYWAKGLQQYFLLGYAVNVVRKLIPKMAKLFNNPTTFLNVLFNKDNFRFGLFFGSYVALYRYTSCFLLKTRQLPQMFHSIVGGLISGVTFALAPNLQVLASAFTMLLQILYGRMKASLKLPNVMFMQQALFMICNGLLLHNRCMSPDTCPAYYTNMVNVNTNKVFSKVYDKFLRVCLAP